MTEDANTNRVEPMPLPDGELPEMLRVQIVDDDPFDRERIQTLCGATDLNLAITESSGLASFREALDRGHYDLVFIDYRLTDGNGLEALDMIKNHPVNNSAAVIMIAGEAHVDVAVTALKKGCADYIFKDALQVATIRRAMVTAIQRASMRRDLFAAEQRSGQLSATVAYYAERSAQDLRPGLETMRKKIAALRMRLRRIDDPELEALLEDLSAIWKRAVAYCDQVEAAALRVK